MKRKTKKRSPIKTTKREPKWKRELNSAIRSFKREAWNVLAGIGIGVVLLLIARAL